MSRPKNRLKFATLAEAQVVADDIHAQMIASNQTYAASVAAGHTTAWAVPYQDYDASGKLISPAWYVNVKKRCGTVKVPPRWRLWLSARWRPCRLLLRRVRAYIAALLLALSTGCAASGPCLFGAEHESQASYCMERNFGADAADEAAVQRLMCHIATDPAFYATHCEYPK